MPSSAPDLPEGIHACLFDLDGVLTKTALVHDAAWTEVFNDYLRRRADQTGEPFVPFDPHDDYDRYIDGRPRADGIRAFLASRHIDLPEGSATDPPSADTVEGIGLRKNNLFLQQLRDHGVEVYEGSIRFVHAVRDAGFRGAVVSASTNCHQVLAAAGIEDLFDTVVDGNVTISEYLHGKPAPDTYLAAARRLGVEPAGAAVFEDALAGVESGRAGGFGFVVGVDRVGQADALSAHGANRVVTDLAELLVCR